MFDLFWNRLTFAILFLLSMLCGAGCQGGLPMWSQANPCTEFTINPVNKTVSFYSNDGRAMNCDELSFKADSNGGKEFIAKKLIITERSVENRVANAQQLEVIDKITDKMMDPWRILASRIPMPGAGGAAPTTQPSNP